MTSLDVFFLGVNPSEVDALIEQNEGTLDSTRTFETPDLAAYRVVFTNKSKRDEFFIAARAMNGYNGFA